MIKRALGNTGYTVSAVAYGGIVSMNDGPERDGLKEQSGGLPV